MPSSLVWSITQDQDGYLWLGTDLGLLRFDGVRFVPADSLPGVKLEARPVRTVFAPKDGGVWIGFGDGSGVGRLVNGRFISYPPSSGVPARVVSLVEDHEGTLWAGGLVGLSRFRDGSWTPLPASSGLPAQASVFGVYEDSANTLWVSTSVGAFRRQPGVAQFEAVDIATRVYGFAEDATGKMWIAGREAVDAACGLRRSATVSGASRPIGTVASGENVGPAKVV
jgi:ligand-binding sensor domain-containing protein